MLFESVFYEFMQSFSGIALFSRDGDRFYKCIHWDSGFLTKLKEGEISGLGGLLLSQLHCERRKLRQL